MLSSAEKKTAETLGKIIESAEVHYTFCDVELRRTLGLITKFRRKQFFSAEVSYIICVVEFRRKIKNKVRKKKCNRFGGTGSQKFRRKKKQLISGRLMPHNRPQRKKGPQSP